MNPTGPSLGCMSIHLTAKRKDTVFREILETQRNREREKSLNVHFKIYSTLCPSLFALCSPKKLRKIKIDPKVRRFLFIAQITSQTK